MTRDSQSRDGHRLMCKRCRAPRVAARKALYPVRTPAEIEAARSRLRPDGLKRCRRCRVYRPLACFSADRTCADGLHNACRLCVVTPLLRLALPRWAELDTWSCVYCAAPYAHTDHVWPSSDGGPDVPANLAPACAPCNLSKSDRPVLAFVAERLGADLLDIIAGWPWRVIDL